VKTEKRTSKWTVFKFSKEEFRVALGIPEGAMLVSVSVSTKDIEIWAKTAGDDQPDE
jgi:hypothetical protein